MLRRLLRSVCQPPRVWVKGRAPCSSYGLHCSHRGRSCCWCQEDPDILLLERLGAEGKL